MNIFKWSAIFVGICFCACSETSSTRFIGFPSEIEDEKEICQIGSEGCGCYEENKCFPDLTCIKKICVHKYEPEKLPEGDVDYVEEIEVESEAEAEAEIDPEIEIKPEVELEPEPEAELIIEIEPEAELIIEIEPEAEPIIEIESEAETKPEAEPIIEIEADPEIEPICLNNADGLEIPGDGIDQNCVGFDRTPQVGDCFFAPDHPNGTGTMNDPTSNMRMLPRCFGHEGIVYWFAVGEYFATTGSYLIDAQAIVGGRDPITWEKAEGSSIINLLDSFGLPKTDIVISNITIKNGRISAHNHISGSTTIQKIIIVDSLIYSHDAQGIDLRNSALFSRITLLRNNFHAETEGDWIFYITGATTIEAVNACEWIGCIQTEDNISTTP
jgi:hypothetical protein